MPMVGHETVCVTCLPNSAGTHHQDDGCAGFFVGNGVVEQGLGFVAFALDFVAAEGMDGLGGKTDVGTDGDAAQLQEFGGFGHPDAAFEFDHMRACGHQFGGGGEGSLLCW